MQSLYEAWVPIGLDFSQNTPCPGLGYLLLANSQTTFKGTTETSAQWEHFVNANGELLKPKGY